MSEARYLVGDVFDRLAEVPDGSVDLVVTSPPFLALRSYLPADHPDKGKEIGSEATPAAFLSTLLALTREWRRVLAPHGSLCVELGDTYSGSGGAGGDYGEGGLRDGQPMFRQGYVRNDRHNRQPQDAPKSYSNGRRNRPADVAAGILAPTKRPGPGGRDEVDGWPLDKSLCGIPDAYMLSLIYGWNMLDPWDGERYDTWRARNKVVWHRPNPPVGALGDKVRPSTSYVTVACTSRTRWFDLDPERTEHTVDPSGKRPVGMALASKGISGGDSGNADKERLLGNPAGAPPLDCWIIATSPYKGSHYATWPPALCRKLINLMCPRSVCMTCGEPRRRIVETSRPIEPDDSQRVKHANGERPAPGRQDRAPEIGWEINRVTVGWTDCGHDTWRRGLVLDPFAGSGTTLMAASELGRDSIGIDLDERNLHLARQRIGMFLTEDEVPA